MSSQINDSSRHSQRANLDKLQDVPGVFSLEATPELR